jgi:hypothetical protein
MSAILAVGVDIGSQKTMMSKDDADIVRTDTGMLKCCTSFSFGSLKSNDLPSN